MQMQIDELSGACYLQFETRAKAVPGETTESGAQVFVDVDHVLVTPQGSHDQLDVEAEAWISGKEQMRDTFARQYRDEYNAWKEGKEPVVNGTDIKMWPSISPAELKTLQAARVRSVEELAGANDGVIKMLGMGGTTLVERAKAWLASTGSNGKVAAMVEDLQAQINNMQQQMAEKDEQIADLRKMVPPEAKQPAAKGKK